MGAMPVAVWLFILQLQLKFSLGSLKVPHLLVPEGANSSFPRFGNTSTSRPTPSCRVEEQDPDQGINSMYCTCDEYVTLPLLTPTPDSGDITSSCIYESYPASVTARRTSASPSMTSSPTPSCEVQEQDPDEGIDSMYCICDETINLPLLTPTPANAANSASCSYKSYPASVRLQSSPSTTATSSRISSHDSLSTKVSVTLLQNMRSPPQALKNVSNATYSITAGPSSGLQQGYYANGSATSESTCVLSEAYCPFKDPKHAMDGLKESCLLWDPKNSVCSGNKTSAMLNMPFDVMNELYNNACFVDLSEECSARNPPGRISAFAKVKSWMRSPQCRSSSAEYKVMQGYAPDLQHLGPDDMPPYFSCCYDCWLYVYNADVYYWPSHNMNTSCESIIGDQRLPLDYGATTEVEGYGDYLTSVKYWGCVTWMTDSTRSEIWRNTQTLATIATIGSMSIKQYMFNPWSSNSSLCTSYKNISAPPSSLPGFDIEPIVARGLSKPIHARAHSLIGGSITIGTGGQLISTMVSDGYTFTSPSVYVNFRKISASDNCGTQVILSTMMAFAPGELSTIAGPLNGFWSNATTTKAFNFADLPCPPQSVMEQNWYTPLLGQPYLPLIAFPKRLLDLEPYFDHCSTDFFTALDPPRTLQPAIAMVADITTGDPIAPSLAAIPSPTQDPGPENTGLGIDPEAAPLQNAYPQVLPDIIATQHEGPVFHTEVSQMVPQPAQTGSQQPTIDPGVSSEDFQGGPKETHTQAQGTVLDGGPVAGDPNNPMPSSTMVDGPQPAQAPASSGQGADPGLEQQNSGLGSVSQGQSSNPGIGESASQNQKPAGSQQVTTGDDSGQPDIANGDSAQEVGSNDPNSHPGLEQPSPSNDPSNLSPAQMAQLKGALSSNPEGSSDQSQSSTGSSDPSHLDSGTEQGQTSNHFDPSNVSPGQMAQIKDALSGSLNAAQDAANTEGYTKPIGSAGDAAQPINPDGSPGDPPSGTLSGTQGPDSANPGINPSSLASEQLSNLAKILAPSGSPSQISLIAQALAPSGSTPSPPQISALGAALVASGSNLSPDQISNIAEALAPSGPNPSPNLLAKLSQVLDPSGSISSPQQLSSILNALAPSMPTLSPEQVTNINNALATSGSIPSPDQLANVVKALAPSGSNLSPDQVSNVENVLATSGPSLLPEQISSINDILMPTASKISPAQILNIENALAPSGSLVSPDQISNIEHALAADGSNLSPTQISDIIDHLAPNLFPSNGQASFNIPALSSAIVAALQTESISSSHQAATTAIDGQNAAPSGNISTSSSIGPSTIDTGISGSDGSGMTASKSSISGKHTKASDGTRACGALVGIGHVSVLMGVAIHAAMMFAFM